VFCKTSDPRGFSTDLANNIFGPVDFFRKEGPVDAMSYVEYVTSKAGMNALTKAFAMRLGPYITVNAICPGYMKTEMVAHNDPETERVLLHEIALKRFGTPEEVARSAVFLASDEANFMVETFS